MELKVTRHGAASQVAVLHPGAQVDGRSAFQFEQDVLELLQDGTKYIVVDFAAVNLFASAGIRVLILMLHKLDARDGALVLCGLNQYVRNVLDVSGLTSQFTIVGTIADAVKAMPAGEDTSEIGSAGASRPEAALDRRSTAGRRVRRSPSRSRKSSPTARCTRCRGDGSP